MKYVEIIIVVLLILFFGWTMDSIDFNQLKMQEVAITTATPDPGVTATPTAQNSSKPAVTPTPAVRRDQYEGEGIRP